MEVINEFMVHRSGMLEFFGSLTHTVELWKIGFQFG